MNDSQPRDNQPGGQPHGESLHYRNELSGKLLDAVEQIASEPHADASLQRALRRACQLETPADAAEVRRQDSSRARSVLPIQRVFTSNRRMLMATRIAAAVLALAGIGGLTSWLAPHGAGAAFAQVQQAIEKARTVTFDVATQSPGQPPATSRVLVLAPGRVRLELPDGETMVHDPRGPKTLLLRTQQESAIVIEGQQPTTTSVPANLVEKLRTMHASAAEKLPSQNINGVEAAGYRLVQGDETLEVWVNPATDLPVRIESKRRQPDGGEVVETGSNFVFDAKLDAALFSTDPPAGYAVETRKIAKPTDDASIASLVLTAGRGLGPVRFGMTKAEAVKALGQPDETRTSGDGGETLRYDRRGFWIGLGSDGKVRDIACHAHPDHATPVAKTFAGKTSDGIVMGASGNDISTLLGPPNVMDGFESRFGKTTTMTYWELGLAFTLQNDSLTEIHASQPKQAAK